MTEQEMQSEVTRLREERTAIEAQTAELNLRNEEMRKELEALRQDEAQREAERERYLTEMRAQDKERLERLQKIVASFRQGDTESKSGE